MTLEELYAHYPKRDGSQRKKDGLATLARLLEKNPALIDSITAAVQNYKSHCDEKKLTGTDKVLQFRTFINGIWEEWVERKPVRRLEVVYDWG